MNLIQRKIAVKLIEYDLMVRPTDGMRLGEEAREVLIYWSKWADEKRQIRKQAGGLGLNWLGRLVKSKEEENNVHENNHRSLGDIYFTDDQMIGVDQIIQSLIPIHKAAIHVEYVEFGSIADKAKMMKMRKDRYKETISNAHDEFIAKGGLDKISG